MDFCIYEAGTLHLSQLSQLSCELWPDHTPEEMAQEFAVLLTNDDHVCFLAEANGTAVGFAHCSLRRDYVEGTDSSPVGYLEGIYIASQFRGRGAAKLLLASCEQWVKSKGCPEFASDCELDNTDSLNFHLKSGFQEAGRIICFTKKLN